MKKHLLNALAIITAMALHHTATAQCTWQIVGTGAVSGSTYTSMYSDIAMGSSNAPYVVYSDGGAGNAATVKTFSAGAWTTVGTGSVNANTAYNSIALSPAGIPYIAFQDKSAALLKAKVMAYNGSAWVAVGTGTISTDTASYTSIAIDNSGVPYVAFVDRASGKKAVVKKYSAGSWSTVGTAVSTGTAAYTYLAIDAAGTPYLAYEDMMNGGKATVKKFNGTSWIAVGTGTVSPTTAAYVSLALDNAGSPYVAYIDGSGYIATVKNFSTGSWQTVGSSTVAATNVYTALDLTLDPAGTPYISYYDLGMYKTSVSKYNGSAWSYAGNGNFSTGVPSITSMVTDQTGIPYIASCEGPAYVRKLSSGATVTLQPAPATVCANSSVVFSAATNTTGVTYQWQVNTGANYVNLSAGANYNGVNSANLTINSASLSMGGYLYRCVMNDGCTNIISNGASLTVNALPTVGVNSSTICAGGTATLSATGLNTYLWNTGATTMSIAVTLTASASFNVNGADINGCAGSASGSVSVISSKTLSGTASSTAGAVSGNMILYKYSPTLSKWDSVAFTPFSSIFSFGTVDSASYVVKAVPTATNMQITYGTSAISWQNASVIQHGCALNSTQHVQVLPYSLLPAGAGVLAGNISEGSGYGHKGTAIQGNPIPGVVVKGGRNPGGAIFAETTTDATGHYAFSNLPDDPNDSYFVLVDIPGLDTNKTYHEVLLSGNDTYTTLDFVVDSMYVNPMLPTSINELNQADYLVKLFPNPAKNYFTVQYSLLKQSEVKLELFDVAGKRVQLLQPSLQQAPGDYTPFFQTGALSPGMYFVKLLIGRNEATIKVFITD